MNTLNNLIELTQEDYELKKSMLKDTKYDIKQTNKFIEILKINNVDTEQQETKLQMLIGYRDNLTFDLKILKSIIRRLENIKQTYSN